MHGAVVIAVKNPQNPTSYIYTLLNTSLAQLFYSLKCNSRPCILFVMYLNKIILTFHYFFWFFCQCAFRGKIIHGQWNPCSNILFFLTDVSPPHQKKSVLDFISLVILTSCLVFRMFIVIYFEFFILYDYDTGQHETGFQTF